MRTMHTLGITSMLLVGGLSHAAPTTIAGALARQGRYFDRAHQAVTSGGVTPYAHELSAGWGIAKWFGARGAVGAADAEVAGQVHTVGFLRAQGSLGIDFGGGLDVLGGGRFGKPGMSAKELFPHLEGRKLGRLGLARDRSWTADKRVVSNTEGISWGIGLAGGLSLTFASVGGPSRKTDQLKQIEQGQARVKEGLEAVARGDETAAAKAFVAVEAVHAQIRKDKAKRNEARYNAYKAVE